MATWADLKDELDAWTGAGSVPTFWWRDDDAVAAGPKLERLLAVRAELRIPLALAVIPARAERDLVDRLAGEGEVAVLQHGWAHANHAPPGEGKAELGGHRPLSVVLADLAAGRRRMDALFDRRWLPVLVPPYNRICEAATNALPGLGLAGLSGFAPRAAVEAAPGVRLANTHVDIIDWRGHRGFVGEAAALGQVLRHLRDRRGGGADADEPTGLLTHHLAQDEAGWRFVASLWACARSQGSVLPATSVFMPSAASAG